MSIGALRGLTGLDPARLYGAATQTVATPPSFAEALRGALAEVNRLQGERDDTVRGMVMGTVKDPHEVMVITEEAQLAFELMLEVRNRLLESYQEIMRLQV